MIHEKFPHRLLYILFISLIAFGLSMGKSLMSIGVIAISANWILEGGFREKLKTLKDRKYTPLFFLIIFCTYLMWALFSSNLTESLNDVKRLLPFLALPLTIGSSKSLTKKEVFAILGAFILGLLISAGVGFQKYFTGNYEDYRELSVFVSHIRLGLFLGLGIAASGYLIVHTSGYLKLVYILPILYMLFFIRILGSGTGYLSGGLGVTFVILYIAKASSKKWIFRAALGLVLVGVIVVGTKAFLVYENISTPRSGVFDNIPEYTAQMNRYDHHPEYEIYENGYPVYMNYCVAEIGPAWEKRSNISIDSLDNKGQLIHGTLMRYMTSKGMMKDAEGIAQLSEKDIVNIENGVSSIVPPKTGFSARVEEIALEYNMFRIKMNPNGHSLVQRLYYLEAGWNIFKDNLLFGISTGLQETAYKDYYLEANSPLLEEHRLKAHNQLLSFLVCLGIAGTLLILFGFIYPLLQTPMNYLGIIYLLITMIGFLADDMLDRQAGVTFTALFYALFFLSGSKLNRNNIVSDTVN